MTSDLSNPSPETFVCCPRCGAYCMRGDHYCPRCGAEIGTEANSRSDLGVENDPAPLYCVHCGGELKQGAERNHRSESRVTDHTHGRDRDQPS